MNPNKIKPYINSRILKKNYQTYRPFMASASAKMFWVSIAITLSFVISQTFLFFTR